MKLSKQPCCPFPQHSSYDQSIIKPNLYSQAQLDDQVKEYYLSWKTERLKEINKDQYYIDVQGEAAQADIVAVSEGQGYGLLIMVMFAGFEPSAKKYFDGLFKFFKNHPSSNEPNFMSWCQDKNLNNCHNHDSATDGDLDIALALLLADKQWGSEGAINYQAEAAKMLKAFLQKIVRKLPEHENKYILALGDWVYDTERAYDVRASDFMLSHLKAFKKFTNNNVWQEVRETIYGIVHSAWQEYSPAAGLLPDFLVWKNNKYVPAEAGYLEREHDGHYFYNACRIPWRLAIDYILSGDNSLKKWLDQLNSWIITKTNGDPAQIKNGYYLDGTEIYAERAMSFMAPFAVSAMTFKDQQWLNNLWETIIKSNVNQDGYYGGTIKLLCMLVISGNWWSI